MKRYKIVLLSIALILGSFLTTQAQKNDDYRHRPGQITFISPLGTNGFKSGRTINHFSLNILAGYSGGVQGLEVGGLVNIVQRDMLGIQLAGLGNNVMGGVTGVQVSGLYNFARRSSEGAQLAGIVNFIGGGAYAFQGAGIINIVGRNSRGAQAAGLVNFTGLSFSGAQVAGLLNIAGREVRGAQISGLVNYTRKLNGVQIGVINIADSVESGIPIGVLSLVKNGYHKLEVAGNESLHTTLSLKIGVQKFYNIFSVGAIWDKEPFTWAVGYGVGTAQNLGKKTNANLDFITYYLNEGETWSHEANLLSKLQLSLGWQLFPRFTLFGGISINAHIRDANEETLQNIPGSFYQYSGHWTQVNIYPGFQFGIRM